MVGKPDDAKRIYFIINEVAKAYEGIISADCYHQLYMPKDELLKTYWDIPQRQVETSVVLGVEVV